MPTLLRAYGFRFHFYAADLSEPPHVHVDGHGGEAKFWLDNVEIAFARGLSRRDLAKVRTVVIENRGDMLEVWRGYLGRGPRP